jgi:carboxyl-terminal processing protease
MSMRNKIRKWVVPGALFLALGAGSLWAKSDTVYDQIDLLVDVRHELIRGYVESPNQQKMVENAVRAMVESVNDPFTVYMSPTELEQFDKAMHGSFSGIGAEVDIQDNRLKIVTPLDDSPAFKAGIIAGDTVMEIDGTSTEGKSIQECIKLLMGKEGTPVILKVRHENGDEATIWVTRGRINVLTVKGFKRGPDGKWDFMLDPASKVGYVRISVFSDATADETAAAVRGLIADGAKGIIIDVRFNPGGLLGSAVDMGNLFLPKDKRIVSVKGRTVPEQIMVSSGKETIPDVPLAILANESSASAAEILTGALSDNDRAKFIGTRTFGKGSVQSVIKLENNLGALKMTNAYYYLPNGRNIHRREGNDTWGVDPQDGFYVPMSTDEMKAMIDARRKGDVLKLGGTGGGTVTPEMLKKDLADPQLAAALTAIHGKIHTGNWTVVGQSNAPALAKQTKHDNLTRQRDQLKTRLDQVEKELAKVDGTDKSGNLKGVIDEVKPVEKK